MTKPTIIFATLAADHPQNAGLSALPDRERLVPVGTCPLVAVELPANCSVDGSTSEVQVMLANVEEHLRMRVWAAYTKASGDGVAVGGAPEGGTCDPSRYAAWKDNLDWIAADTVARVRTLLGAPRDAALQETPDMEGCWFVYGDEDDDDAPYHDRLNAIEHEYGVTIEISDTSGTTFVYAYTADGDRLCFEFNSMNPDIEDVEAVATAIAALKRASDKRPAVGKLAREP